MEVKSHELKKIEINLLNLFNQGNIKFREIDGQIDLFFITEDLFVFLNKNESLLFKKIFLKKSKIKTDEEKNFIIQLYEEQKRYTLL